jgi:PAS domain S-box-containing protein
MKEENKTKKQLINELAELRQRIIELESSNADSKHTEERLKETKDYLDKIIASSLDGIVASDYRGYITRVNKAFLKLIDFEEEEVVGKHVAELTPYENGTYESTTGELVEINEGFIYDATGVKEELFEKGAISNWESYYLRKDGKIIPVEIKISYLYNDEGDIIGSVGINRDITERRQIEKASREAHQELEKRVEERTANLKATNEQLKREIAERKQFEKMLKESEEKYRLLSEASAEGIYQVDASGHYIFMNEAYAEILGYERKELLGKHSRTVIPEDEMERAFKIPEDINLGNTSRGEFTVKHKFGHKIPVYYSMVPQINQGRITGYTGTIIDITERKRSEEAFKKTKDHLDNIIESSIDSIIVSDSEGKITRVNRAFLELTGYKKEEIIGHDWYDFTPGDVGTYELITGELLEITEDYFYETKRILEKLYEEGKIENRETYLVRKDGEVVLVENNISFLYGEKGAIGGVGIIRDISERKATEKRLLEHQEQLKSLTSQMTLTEEKERKSFSDYLHDQIGQQLFVLKLRMGTLQNYISSNEASKTLADSLEIIEQIIKDTRSLTFELSPPILYQLGLEAALDWLTEQVHKQYGIIVTFEDDGEEKLMDDDVKIILFQAVRELLTNVAKHAQSQKATVSIQKDNGHIRICVEDDGVGFTPALKQVAKDESKGFGLFSIKERLDHLGGNMEIVSKAGLGTQATLIVPLKGKGQS